MATFRTAPPQLAVERASRTPLFVALEQLAPDAATLEALFDTALAPALQTRESALVNALHEWCRAELATQLRAHERADAHWQSRLDRRVAETNELRKDFYKQLLMLRELVQRHRNDAKTLKALDDVITAMAAGKDKPLELPARSETSNNAGSRKPEGRSAAAAAGGGQASGEGGSAYRRKEKWEERAREAIAECQQLQEQVIQLKQQNEELCSSEADGWFASARNGLAERQRVIDAVYRAKCSWDDVGAAVLEVLNNDLIWDAVERSARRGKERASRGLEALLTHLDALDGTGDPAIEKLAQQSRSASSEDAASTLAPPRAGAVVPRRSSSDPVRLIQCRACNGAGFVDPNTSEDGNSAESDAYLRKTLAQVLELRAALASAGERSQKLEQQLQATEVASAAAKKQLEEIEFVRRHGVNCCVQADLDDEDVVDLEEILRASASDLEPARKRFSSNRSAQYEHLIVELKSALDEKVEAISELRSAHSDAQDRLRSSQLASQREQEAHLQEVATLKTTLSLALTQQNAAIEEKQTAVTLMLQKFGKQRSTSSSIGDGAREGEDEEASGGEGGAEQDDLLALDARSEEALEKLGEVERSEAVARRYSQAIVRVQREYESQKSLLRQSEEEIDHADERRQRTNSIALGSIVVSVASHPRELFKALSTTQSELLSVRRASQRASTLQTDRLLTLTTHLGHLSEELCMVRKRTKAEIEFWKLECEKTQNANKVVLADLQKTQLQLQAANERRVSVVPGTDACALCERHEARLVDISSALLLQDTQQSLQERAARSPDADELLSHDTPGDAVQLTQQERQRLSRLVLEIENLTTMMTVDKQENARRLVAFTLLGGEASEQIDLHVKSSAVSGAHDDDRRKRSSLTFDSDAYANSVDAFRMHANSVGSIRAALFGADLQVSGTTLSGVGGGVDVFARSHHKKKIVRKILSEDEAMRRKFARAHQRAAEQDNNASACSDDPEHQAVPVTLDVTGADEAAGSECSSYVDENGLEVFYEDVEVEDDSDDEADNNWKTPGTQDSEQRVESAVLSGTPKPLHRPRDERARVRQASAKAEPARQSQAPRELTLLDDQTDIAGDPQVITQLRDLVKQHAGVKEALALLNWRILICHMRSLRGQSRLEWITRESKRVGAAGNSLRSSQRAAVRSTMQRLVEFRESSLDAEIRARDEMRKEVRRAQALLIHSVSTILTNLSRKPRTPTSDSANPSATQRWEGSSSPRKYQTLPNRALYPAAHVNLSEIPSTQQIPTAHFPAPRLPSSSSPPRQGIDGRPVSANARKLCSFVADDTVEFPEQPSAFEDDNRFPQRAVRFVGPSDGYEFSLTHSLSSIARPPRCGDSSPAQDPSRSSALRTSSRLTTRYARRPATDSHSPWTDVGAGSRSASPRKRSTDDQVYGMPGELRHLQHGGPDPTMEQPAALATRQLPVRPQSSPAGLAPRTFSPRPTRELLSARLPTAHGAIVGQGEERSV